jgi:hemolysin activation/secretion protein
MDVMPHFKKRLSSNIGRFFLPLAALVFPFESYAQALLSPSVNPSVVGQQIEQSQQFPKTNVALPAKLPSSAKPGLSAEAQRVRFKLNKLTIVGSKIYGNEKLAYLFRNYVGKTISVADLQQIADIITAKYRRDGYILSKAILPQQVINNGEVTIQVIEGYIHHTSIQGNPRGSATLIKAYGNRIEETSPLALSNLERYTLLANNIPGASTRAVISPSVAQIPGAADLTFVTQEQPVNGYLSFDNRGTRYLGPNEFSAGLNVNSLFVSGDKTGIQLLNTSKTNQLKYGRVYYQVPLNSDGLQLNLAAAYVHTNPDFLLEPLNVVGISRSASASLSYPLILTQNQNLYINGGFDIQNSRNDIKIFTPPVNIYDDKLRSVRVGLSYGLADRFQGINQISSQYSQGLDVLGASKNNSAFLSRPNGKSDYKKITLDASRIQNLGHNFSVLAGMKSQYAFTALLSEEQFYFGGIDFGRAYDPAEIAGDHGLAGKLELRYDTDPGFMVLQHVQYYTFYDIGKIWNVNNNQFNFPNNSASSAGLGLRTNFTRYLLGGIEWAKPLTEKVATENNKNPRVFFNLSLVF